jgi:hypothetical protein
VSRVPGRHLSDTERDEIHQALRRGEKPSYVARRLGHSENTVRREAHRMASDPGPPPAPPPPADPLHRAIVAQVMADLEARGLLSSPQVAAPPPPAPADPPPLPPAGHTRVVVDDSRPGRVAFLSDLHVPFLCERAWGAAMSLLEDYRPDLVVLGGDLFDFYSISAHDKEPGRLDRLQDEFDAAAPLWKQVDALSGRKVVIWGNHEERLIRLTHANPGLVNLRALTIEAAAEMPQGWTYYPNQTRLKVGPLSILHGDLKGRGTSSVHAASGFLRKLRTSCLAGHLHRFQSFFETNADGTIRAGFASGHLSDPDEARYLASPDWQQGFTTIDFDHEAGLFSVTPHLIIEGRTRWNGKTYAG